MAGCFWLAATQTENREGKVPKGKGQGVKATAKPQKLKCKTAKTKRTPGARGEGRPDGELPPPDDTTATIRTGDGSERAVAYADIDRARTQFEWGPAPKPGKGSKPGKAPKRGPAKKQGSAKPATTTSGDDTPTEGHNQP